ncbi:MAG: uncharacterized protein KVP18_003906 [Porospora cf. gigantea A]|nr:MAG: hypothetical protein KVP18_003906 [Porospora cf. gigantea A]
MAGNGTMSVTGYSQAINQGQMASQMGQMTSTAHTAIKQDRIISERYVEHEVRVPKKVYVEEVVEKVIVVPEKVVHEQMTEDTVKIREKIIEIARPVYQEKIVEVPEYEYVDKYIEVPEKIIQEKIREVPVIDFQERIIEVPRIVWQERVVEVPEYEYVEVPVEKIVEVPEIREEYQVRHVTVPQYVDKPVPEYTQVEEITEIVRSSPVPVLVETVLEFNVPKIRPLYRRVDMPLYVPRFIEIAVPVDLVKDDTILLRAQTYCERLRLFVESAEGGSLTDLESIAFHLKQLEWQRIIETNEVTQATVNCWERQTFVVDDTTISTLEKRIAECEVSRTEANTRIMEAWVKLQEERRLLEEAQVKSESNEGSTSSSTDEQHETTIPSPIPARRTESTDATDAINAITEEESPKMPPTPAEPSEAPNATPETKKKQSKEEKALRKQKRETKRLIKEQREARRLEAQQKEDAVGTPERQV